jgi:HEAT repeat protein
VTIAMRTPRSEIPAWLELTRSPDHMDRRKALQSLCPCELKSDSAEVWARVLEMADDTDARVRRWVIHVLCDGSPARYRDDILDVLESRYHDPDERVRKSARRVLATYRRLGNVNVL